jgi:hypothetical protein
MFALIVITTVLAVLYGLGWHNQPAKENENAGPESRSFRTLAKGSRV